MLVTLKDLLNQYLEKDAIVGAFNATCFYDAKPIIRAAEKMNAPVIIGVSPLAAKTIELGEWSLLLRDIAEKSSIPICLHLDHGRRIEDVKKAVDVGFPSVMFDGSQLPYEENVAITKEVVEYAHPKGVSVEAEIGSVAYTGNEAVKAILSDPDVTANFVADTGIDAVAVAVGTLHQMKQQGARVDFDLIKKIEEKVSIPLVIHGASGLLNEEIIKLRSTRVCKMNIGTALRLAFNNSLRKSLDENQSNHNYTELLDAPMQAVEEVVLGKLELLGF
ncbi:MAG: class II fructose-bisphosphate aldolase [Anaerolineaceae bacterium]|jgi:fructose-bisphosphate aldolase class II|nr:class II fructose-bisphosphate aldolase [Anaerolineaceae bacterium]